jgi:hypothetical protein
VTNSGDLSGSYKLVLKINDRQVDSREVTVAGGKTETVSFEVQRGLEAEYTVDVNGQKGHFTVGTPATVPSGTISELTPTSQPGQVIVPTTVKNTPQTTLTMAAPPATAKAPAAASPVPENEEKPTPPFLWPFIYMAVVAAILTLVFLYQYKWKNRKTR